MRSVTGPTSEDKVHWWHLKAWPLGYATFHFSALYLLQSPVPYAASCACMLLFHPPPFPLPVSTVAATRRSHRAAGLVGLNHPPCSRNAQQWGAHVKLRPPV